MADPEVRPLTEVFAALSAASLRGAKGDWDGCLVQLDAARARLSPMAGEVLEPLMDLVEVEIAAAARLRRRKKAP